MAVSSIENTLLETSLSNLTLLSRGKVRDVYSTSDPSTLLFIATDRISAYDVVLNNVRLRTLLFPDLVLSSYHSRFRACTSREFLRKAKSSLRYPYFGLKSLLILFPTI